MSTPAGDRPLRGCALMLASTVFFSSMHISVRIASESIHPFEVAFFRNAFGVIVLAPFFARHGLGVFRTGRPILHGVRSLFNVIAMGMFFMALSLAPMAQVQALTFTAPIFTMILAGLILHERISLGQWLAVAVAFIGAMVIVRPGFDGFNPGALLVVGSSAIWGLVMIIIKILSRTDSSITITAWMVVLMSLFSAIPAWLVWKTPVGHEWTWLLVAGVLGTAAQLMLTEALNSAPATVVLPLDFAKIIWGALLAYLIFAETVTLFTWIGAIMIFAAGTWLTLRHRRGAKTDAAKPAES